MSASRAWILTSRVRQYFYYFLSALGRRVAWAPLVTFLQIAQMFVGSYICIQIELAKRAHVPCAVTPMCHFTTSLMYASYLVLFCHFAWYRYGPGKRPTKREHNKDA